MNVQMVVFPETKVATVEHRGSPSTEHDTVRKLVARKIENGFLDQSLYRSYGVHYTNPHTTSPTEHQVDFCLSIDRDVAPNGFGVIKKVIPRGRCALVRHLGSRAHNSAAVYLYEKWLPESGDLVGSFPVFFHYVNVGPHVREVDMVTDVYLPLA